MHTSSRATQWAARKAGIGMLFEDSGRTQETAAMFKRLPRLESEDERPEGVQGPRLQMRVVTEDFVEPDHNAFKPTLTDAPSAQLIRLATIYQSLAKSIKPQDVRQRIEISKELAGQAVLLIEEAERTRRELILALGGAV